MSLIMPKRPWYANGLAFECTGCGNCCSGPGEGYVWVTPEEIAAIAEHLGMTVGAVEDAYTRRIGRRVSLIEAPNKDCIFLGPPDDDGVRRCRIYDLRPTQCRTWPFWPSNLRSPGAWASAQARCPGINRGELHSLDHIEDEKSHTWG
ncbi:MAG: YkgJ family cysteine cluster protein [Planctomycetota bacterium]